MTRTEGEVKKNGLAAPWYGAGKVAAIEVLRTIAQCLAGRNFLLLRGEKEYRIAHNYESAFCIRSHGVVIVSWRKKHACRDVLW